MALAAKREAAGNEQQLACSSSVHAPHDAAAKPASLSAAWEPLSPSPKRSVLASKANGASPLCLGFRDMVKVGFATGFFNILKQRGHFVVEFDTCLSS